MILSCPYKFIIHLTYRLNFQSVKLCCDQIFKLFLGMRRIGYFGIRPNRSFGLQVFGIRRIFGRIVLCSRFLQYSPYFCQILVLNILCFVNKYKCAYTIAYALRKIHNISGSQSYFKLSK